MTDAPTPPRNPWDDRFAGEDFTYGTAPNEFLAAHAGHYHPGSHILSLGEGEGRNGVHLATLGHRVTAIDGSRVGLEKAARFAASRGVSLETVCGDLATVPFPARLDGVLNIFCHLPSALRRAVHRRAQSALVPGGIFLAELYRPEQLAFRTGGPPDVDLLVRLEDLVQDLDACELLEGREIERPVVEGRLHTGMAAVVQAVFRRLP